MDGEISGPKRYGEIFENYQFILKTNLHYLYKYLTEEMWQF